MENIDILNKKACVIGMGYVGLTLAVTLSEVSFKTFGIEKRENIVKLLESGKAHFYEPGLNEKMVQEMKRGLKFLTAISEPLADIYILAIGTPVKGEEKKPSFEDLASSMGSVARVLKNNDLVILRSTVPPGTTREYVIPLLEKISNLKAGKDFFVAFAPERTIEGKALEELRHLPQVIGGYDGQSIILAENFFKTMTPHTIRVSSLEAAEMVKLINNLHRDVSFAFANEMALVCDKFNLDSYEVIDAANFGYERSAVPKPSPGVGGYCLTKDPHILNYALNAKGMNLRLIREARSINKYMPHYVAGQVEKFLKSVGRKQSESKVFVLGLAFKGNPPTSDVRFSPSVKLARILRDKPMNVFAYDPLVGKEDFHEEGVNLVSLEEGFTNADAVLVSTNHSDFKNLDLEKYLSLTRKPALFFDGWKLHPVEKILNVPHIKYSNLGFDNI